jgi:hypothetical protein
MSPEVARVVALGASNLTRGFPAVVAEARAAWGPGVQILAALGHGRSYGARSRVGVRVLPSILESGLWRALGSLSACPTRAVVADVGNDILYGVPPARILDWVEEALRRLQRATRDVVLTGLPLERIRRLTASQFRVFRSIFFPRCRLSFDQALEHATQVNTGLSGLAAALGARLLHPDPRWYGLDPIHIRRSLLRTAWAEILGVSHEAGAKLSPLEGLKLRCMPPERRWLFGLEQRRLQTGRKLPSGGRAWLY